MEKTCTHCDKIFSRPPSKFRYSKSGLFFCTRGCKEKTQSILNGNISAIQPSHYGRGKGRWEYRKWAIEAYGAICHFCGYDELERMLDVDHIDSNRSNNSLSNLQVLCVWCHALKTRGLIASNGRASDLHSEG